MTYRLQRRALLKIAKIGGIALIALVVVLGTLIGVFASLPPDHVTEGVAFGQPLAIPPLLDASDASQGPQSESPLERFTGRSTPSPEQEPPELVVRTGAKEFRPGKQSETIGINGDYLGPTIRLQTGQQARFQVTNELPDPTTIHWHGMKLPQSMDGGPHSPIQPGETQQTHWKVRNEPATLWYHTHPHGSTAEQVYRGAAGLIIVDNPHTQTPGIPSEYGVTDIPLIVQDRTLDGSGVLVPNPNHGGFHVGDTVLVNGDAFPYHEVPCEPLRLRLLNASNAQRFDFAFDDARPFHLIASDGGFLERPVQADHVLLSPGERAELVVDPRPCEPIRLISRAVIEESAIHRGVQRLFGFGGDQDRLMDVLELRPQGTPAKAVNLPTTLNTINGVEQDQEPDRRFNLDDDRTINREHFEMGRVDFTVAPGTTEVWEIHNRGFTYHPFHVHGVQFLVIDRNGEPPQAHESGWKDTVLVARGDTIRILVPFEPYMDSEIPYVFHCHILEHEDAGMMGSFLVQ